MALGGISPCFQIIYTKVSFNVCYFCRKIGQCLLFLYMNKTVSKTQYTFDIVDACTCKHKFKF